MTAEIINLAAVRKRRQRDEKRAKAAGNRVKFGRTKAAKKKQERERATLDRTLDGKQLNHGDDGSKT